MEHKILSIETPETTVMFHTKLPIDRPIVCIWMQVYHYFAAVPQIVSFTASNRNE